jgi:FMN phosphatase YigB (HAD superfamily)
MQRLDVETSIFFDVDKTLLFDPEPEMIMVDQLRSMGIPTVDLVDPYDPTGKTIKTYVVHSQHVKLLKDHKARGFKVVIWSHNGGAYAEAVARALQLEEYVNFAMSKPTKICDDLTPNEFLPDSIYIKDNAYLNLIKRD